MSILGPMLGRPWLRRRNARLLRDAGRAISEAGYICAGGIDHFVTIRSASRDNPCWCSCTGPAGTGHLAAFTRPDEFLRLLVERVLPVVSGTPD
jgi:hypothetical protein